MNTDDLFAVYVVLSTKGKRKRAIIMDKRLVVEKDFGKLAPLNSCCYMMVTLFSINILLTCIVQ